MSIKPGCMVIEIRDDLSNKLTNASFLAACLVVGIHLAGGPVKIPFVCNMAVPFFFIVSGFLLAGSCEKENWYRIAVFKRIKTLLIPYILVCGLSFAIQFGLHELAVRFAGATPGTMPISWRMPFDVFGLLFYGGPYAVGMWYVRCLILLVLLSPLILPRIVRSHTFALSVAVFFCVVAIGFDVARSRGVSFGAWWNYFYTFGIPPYSVACFVLGCVLRSWRFKIKWPRAIGILSLMLGCTLHYACGARSDFCVVLLMIAGAWQFVPTARWPGFFARNSFALFILHPTLIYLVTYVLKGVHRDSMTHTYFGYLVFFLILVPATCGLAELLRKKCGKFAACLFGGR